MKKKIYRFILNVAGWKIQEDVQFPDKCVICVAPHTSNWDFILGKLVYGSIGGKASFLMKKSWFFFPMNIVFKALGGIPIDRSKNMSMTEQLVEVFNSRDTFRLAITPEGSRNYVTDWKKGFYYIALEAKVPILIAVLDYKEKTAYFKANFIPTGNIEEDMLKIKAYYKGASGKNPNLFSEYK